ncbi:MAG: HicB family protein [Emergencia sp.]|uniref:type II toxin-antitoxin system HicB family antitoxin n=1 Tax=Senimuribacter intestinalis TaxID=2941507 RepID=UPI00203FFF24|nr:type II toxin-antitoxin system HicB family antitoxin [Senimuribacter intestinalis]MCI9640508.1 HicB family protein [Emergencia sp.]
MTKVYPVIFTELNDVCLVEVPDMEILTEGKNLEEAFTMARDAIGIKGISIEDDGETIPEASRLADVKPEKGTFAEEGEGIVSLVDVDFIAYRKKLDQKMVRRNVTLPNWLNQEADAAGVNVSKILQEALMQRLEVQR